MHFAADTHEIEQRLDVFCTRTRPRRRPAARVHQRPYLLGDEPLVDEKVFLDAEPRVSPLEVSGAVVADAMPQRQVLRPRRRADWIGLNESQLVGRSLQGRRWKQAAGRGMP